MGRPSSNPTVVRQVPPVPPTVPPPPISSSISSPAPLPGRAHRLNTQPPVTITSPTNTIQEQDNGTTARR